MSDWWVHAFRLTACGPAVGFGAVRELSLVDGRRVAGGRLRSGLALAVLRVMAYARTG
jgi:hypothetical protein